MAPTGQSSSWSDVLCCRICTKVFNSEKVPINLSCGHTVCQKCLKELHLSTCPVDRTAISLPIEKLPPNIALLSIVSELDDGIPESLLELPEEFRSIESILVELSAYLHFADSMLGGTVWSDELSRPMQRKLMSLLCYQLIEDDGRRRALKAARALADRALSELLICHQNNSSVSSNLWSAVRARGCQFLGPAMQEEVLKLILLTLSEGTKMPRKTLVMYIVQTLREDYPQVSKTCVGHVVQLLYRASCFTVYKRDGESSLMQLKPHYRDYESLRREHDAQIVQVAFEAGLRISPDQWSALLYGDQQHRSHMQSIIDKFQTSQAFERQISDLMVTFEQSAERELLIPTVEHYRRFVSYGPFLELPNWAKTLTLFDSLLYIMKAYVKFMRTRSTNRFPTTIGNTRHNGDHHNTDRRYKTRLCRDTEAGRICPRGLRCTYAHSKNELRTSMPPQLPVVVDPASAAFSVPPPVAAPPPPLLPTASPPIIAMSAVRNGGFVEAKEPPSLNPIGNMMPSPVPLVPMMVPAVNYPIPMPLVPVPGTVVPIARPVTGPTAMTPVLPVRSPQLRIPPASSEYSPSTPSGFMDDESCTTLLPVEQQRSDGSIYELRYDSYHGNAHSTRSYDLDEEEQLILRRHEILSCLGCLQRNDKGDESIDDDDLQSHVSYTVARSVLFEEKDTSSASLLELPPVPLQTAPPTAQTLGNLVKAAAISSTVPTARPLYSQTNSTKPATVQAPCTVMHIKDTIDQPLPTPAIQRSHLPLAVDEDPLLAADHLPPVIRSLRAPPSDPQSVVSDTLDKIVDIRERMNDVDKNGGLGCSVENQQLKVELNIVSRPIQSLDERTKQTCLLRELEAVDKKIENLTITSDFTNLSEDVCTEGIIPN